MGKEAPWPLEHLRKYGVDVQHVHQCEDTPTGRAFIQISTKDGENSIVLLQGANYASVPHLDDPAEWIKAEVTHIMLQNEIPWEVTKAFAAYAETRQGKERVCTVFNPSPMPPADALKEFAWGGIDVLIVNEGEATDLVEAMGGEKGGSPEKALAAVPALRHIRWLVVTQGAHGVLAGVQLDKERVWIDLSASKPEKVVNTTGAGDTFTGYLVAGLMQAEVHTKSDAESVLARAGTAASMAVEVDGAMESIPAADAVARRAKSA